MSLETEKAKLMYKLAVAKKNWGAKYDRLEHFKRFPNLNQIIKELVKSGWLFLYKKQGYKAISLNPEYKGKIIEFIESHLPEVRNNIK
ncbi:MAG: hypothetical protein AABY15_04985 [Nanoarchaeota archaeon]